MQMFTEALIVRPWTSSKSILKCNWNFGEYYIIGSYRKVLSCGYVYMDIAAVFLTAKFIFSNVMYCMTRTDEVDNYY